MVEKVIHWQALIQAAGRLGGLCLETAMSVSVDESFGFLVGCKEKIDISLLFSSR